MSASSLTTFCSDRLHDLLGFSDNNLVDYLVHTARQGKDVTGILVEAGADRTKAASLAAELQTKATTKHQKEKHKTNADWVKQAANYELLEDEEDFPEKKKRSKAEKKQAKQEKKARKRQRQSAEHANDGDDDDDGVVDISKLRQKVEEARKQSSRRRRDNEEKELTPEHRAEQERLKDIQERDELVKRMAERDQQNTKKKQLEQMEQDEQRRQLEERLARGETVVQEDGNAISLDTLREQSRREYLKKREKQQVELLKQQLEDEKELFQNVKLTKAEQERIKLGRQILSMVESRNKDEEDQNDGFYRLPDDMDETAPKAQRDQALLKSRYRESEPEKTEQELWEEAQTLRVSQKKKKRKADDYELVFDDQIDFVIQERTKGYDKRDRKHRQRIDDEEERLQDPKEVRPVTAHEKILAGRKKLPVYAYREEFLAAVKEHQVLILVGETGSGKTTQIPQYLHEIGYSELGKIGCTQPRRVAAMSVATRVAEEVNVKVGREVGYRVRFEDATSPKTIIQYMTDGMLLREILTEPDLASYSAMIIDEAHERTLHTDILFGLIKDIVRFRKDLRLIISSATLDAEKFSNYFDGASIFMIPGRMFPVDIYYTKAPEADYVDAAVVTVLQIHVTQPLDGDILIFLTGQEEIEAAVEILTTRAKNLGSRIAELIICPIYANLPSEQQAKIFEKTPKGARKVVIATNIAETSLTIDGVCYVIDSGFNKQNVYNPRSGMESLIVTPISQAAANQRAGRAGRTQPGKCFRLFTAWSFQHELEPNTVPEILRTNMGNVVLLLKSLGINDLISFDFLDKPPSDALIRALEQLYALGALNDRGELTKLGRRMAEFPLDPMLSKTVIASEKYGCVTEVLSTVSMLSLGASVFYRPKEKAVHADTARLNFARGGGGDHMALLRCYSDWEASEFNSTWCFENFVQVKSMQKVRNIRDQLVALCDRVEIDPELSCSEGSTDPILKSITSGFFYNVAKLGRTGEYQTAKQKRTVFIHPSSVLAKDEDPPAWVVYFELAFTTKEFMRQVAPIDPSWLTEIAPHYYQESEVEDAKKKRMPKARKRQ